ncbi:hypothetical protein GCM10022221_22540 [Actinocorallia aurea]
MFAVVVSAGVVVGVAQPAAAASEFEIVNTLTWDCLDGDTSPVKVLPCDQTDGQSWEGKYTSSGVVLGYGDVDFDPRPVCLAAPVEAPGAPVVTISCRQAWNSQGPGYLGQWFPYPAPDGDAEFRTRASAFTDTPLCLVQLDDQAVLEVCRNWSRHQWAGRSTT